MAITFLHTKAGMIDVLIIPDTWMKEISSEYALIVQKQEMAKYIICQPITQDSPSLNSIELLQMKKQLESRLSELKQEFEKGRKKLNELESEIETTRNTLLRIGGAIQVLEEELEKGASLSNGKSRKDSSIITDISNQWTSTSLIKSSWC